MKLIKYSVIVLLCVLLAACASTRTVLDPAKGFKGQPESKIYQAAEHDLLEGNYSAAVKGFEALDAIYPFGKYAQKAQLDSIYAYYMNQDVASTLAASDRYIHLYPMGKFVPYAYYMRGLAEFYENRGVLEKYFSTDYAQRDLQPLRKSFLDFSQLVYRYPKSIYTPDARQRMIYIRNVLARHELEIANFYYKRMAYVGAANRANDVVQHFQQSASVPGALIMMTEAYTKLKDFPDAKRSLHVLRLNFPKNRAIPGLERDLSVGS